MQVRAGARRSDRIALLASPVFVFAVAVLAINDSILKAEIPGHVTGKLSDFAGVFVVAVLLGVVTQQRAVSVAMTGLGFIALKSVPAIAVAVAAGPMLGGRTEVDPTDLVALATLVPAWWWLGHRLPTRTDEIRRALGVVAGAFALVAITATSCAAPLQVERLLPGKDGALYARTGSENLAGTSWARSSDGKTWTRTRTHPPRPYTEHRSACIADGTCFRVLPDDRVQTRTPGSAWRTEYHYTTDRERNRDHRIEHCGGGVPTFASIVVTGTEDDQHVTVGMGPDGVLWRDHRGHWERRAILDVKPIRLDGDAQISRLAGAAVLGASLILLIAFFAARVATGRWNRWLGLGAGASVLFFIFVGVLEMSTLDFTITAPIELAGAGVLLVASIVMAGFDPKSKARSQPAWGPVAGWFPDPGDANQWRWWNGGSWSDVRAPRE